jgi:hypothetical protein
VNRPPKLTGITVNRNKNGVLTPIDEFDFRNYTLGYGKLYEFNTYKYLSDGDSELEDMDCEWTTDKGQVLAFGKCADYGSINVSAAVKKSKADAKLKPGKHIITVKVTDEMDDVVTLTFTVKVEDAPVPAWQSFDLEMDLQGLAIMFGIFAIFFVIMVVIGYMLATRTGRDRMVGAVIGKATGSKMASRAKRASMAKKRAGASDGYVPPGLRVEGPTEPTVKPKKKVKKKAVKKLKGIKASAPKVKKKKKKVTKKPKWEEDIPDDWK